MRLQKIGVISAPFAFSDRAGNDALGDVR